LRRTGNPAGGEGTATCPTSPVAAPRGDGKSSESVERLVALFDRLTARRGDGLPRSPKGAAWNGDLASVDAYLARGARLDEETSGCRSPLAGAVRSGRAEVVERLLAAGASPDSPGAAETAAAKGRTDLLEMLFAAGLRPDSRRAQLAPSAVRRLDFLVLKDWATAGAGVRRRR